MASASEHQGAPDSELDELLDSALDDFEKTSVPPTAPEAPTAPGAGMASDEKPPLLEDSKFFESLFDGEMANQAREEWEKAMAELAQEEPELLQHFHKLSEAAGKNAGLAGDDLVKTLENLGLNENGEGGEDGNILPIMQSIMQNLLSKEVLYPSLKEITEKYPEWLESNKQSLPTDQFTRYEQQYKIMGEICTQFEKDGDKDSTFENILELMQKLQDLGQPPKELAGEAPPGLNFDPESLHLSGAQGVPGPEQCSIM
ncbi:Peroxisomal biogenesis factor 19 [Labeo rohita]|uniref:Peroxisomal biogenesis factor 19 n=1 Tax=Labeo rohita TaxID=84645 RepID=A0ABQ8MY14_LABRO|nr:Peroxisomal biogenesis factor 19 [Labeo rohita]